MQSLQLNQPGRLSRKIHTHRVYPEVYPDLQKEVSLEAMVFSVSSQWPYRVVPQ